MEAGEGLIEARAHALELVVRVTGDQTCYCLLYTSDAADE